MPDKKPPNHSHPDEREPSDLFREAMADVSRLPPRGRHHNKKSPPSPRPHMTEADNAQVLDQLLDPSPEWLEDHEMHSGEELYYRADGVQNATLRKLRRGQYRIDAELDLHGCTVKQARAALAEFLLQCRNEDWRCVRIIHGKGRGSGQRGPVLKSSVDYWLRQRREVLGFCSARPNEGGTGAAYVLLRKAR